MNRPSDNTTRGEAIGRLFVLPALAGLMAMGTGIAQAKGSKTQFKYQTTPNAGHQCSGCSFFIPGKTKTAAGTCKLVDGSISPTGWCEAYSPKS